jgi:pilus assembly protein CpaB
MGRRTLLLIASILVAALGTALIWLYVQGAESRAEQGQALVKVLVLNGEAAIDTDATKVPLTFAEVPASLAQGAVTDPSTLTGQRLKVAAVPHQILFASMLTSGQAGRFPQNGAVAISISDPNRVPADLQQGDIVDVYSLDQRTGIAKLEVPSVRVRSIGSQVGAGTGAARTGTSTVPVTIVGFDVNAKTAKLLYDMVAAGKQPALYDHNPPSGG